MVTTKWVRFTLVLSKVSARRISKSSRMRRSKSFQGWIYLMVGEFMPRTLKVRYSKTSCWTVLSRASFVCQCMTQLRCLWITLGGLVKRCGINGINKWMYQGWLESPLTYPLEYTTAHRNAYGERMTEAQERQLERRLSFDHTLPRSMMGTGVVFCLRWIHHNHQAMHQLLMQITSKLKRT